jgi:Monooxygenase subunit B protein
VFDERGRAFATLSEPNPRNEALRSQLTAPVLADASIQNFRVSPSAPPNTSRWYALAATNIATIPLEPPGNSTQAFLRMRTLNWYDVKWSKTTVNVNEEYEVTGKLYIMNAWPAAIQVPDQAFLNIGQPGAMANRLGVWVGIFAILSAYSNIIPLQGDNISEIKPKAEEPAPINVEYLGATYKVLDRELRANLKITNEAKEPLQISEFASGGLRFITKENYPDYLLADRTLSLNDGNPLQHGETRNIVLTAQDAKWDTESLLGLDLSNNADRSFAGLLFLNTPSGKRYPVEVGGPVSLNFH